MIKNLRNFQKVAMMSQDSSATSGPTPDETWCARTMFWVAVGSLLCLGGVLHFDDQATGIPLQKACVIGSLLLYPAYLVETAWNFSQRRRRLGRDLLFCLLPPLRLAGRDARMNQFLWLPVWGWQKADERLQVRLQKRLNFPMILVALTVLPLILFEQFYSQQLAERPWLQIAAVGATAVIWIVFTAEFILMCSLSSHRLQYCKEHWIDLVIILLPLVAFLRSLRLSRLARLHHLAQSTGKAYRLRGVALKAWRALLLLDVLRRWTGETPAKRLKRLEQELAACQHQQERLEVEIRETRLTISKSSKELPEVTQTEFTVTEPSLASREQTVC